MDFLWRNLRVCSEASMIRENLWRHCVWAREGKSCGLWNIWNISVWLFPLSSRGHSTCLCSSSSFNWSRRPRTLPGLASLKWSQLLNCSATSVREGVQCSEETSRETIPRTSIVRTVMSVFSDLGPGQGSRLINSAQSLNHIFLSDLKCCQKRDRIFARIESSVIQYGF